jgi:hypothetical protein
LTTSSVCWLLLDAYAAAASSPTAIVVVGIRIKGVPDAQERKCSAEKAV